MKHTVALLCILLSITTYAAEPDNVVLHTNDLAPYEGILMPLSRAQRFHLMDLDLQTCVKVSSLKDDEATVVEQRLKNATEENDQLSKRLASLKDDSFFNKVGYFVLGSLITTVIAYGATRAIK